MRLLKEKALRHVVLGGGLFGAGGGGSVAEGMKIVDRILEYSSGVRLVHPDDLLDDSQGAVIAGMGSPKASLTRVRDVSPRMALEILETNVGFSSDFVIPFELGAGNSLNPMLAAVQRSIPMVDGDPVGRAVPEIDMTTFAYGGVEICPLALANEDGIQVTVDAKSMEDVERVARAVTTELQGVAAIACYPMNGQTLKSLIIPGTTTLAEQIGTVIAGFRDRGEDPSDTLAADFDGYILGRGQVDAVDGETKGGFDFGVIRMEGDIPLTVRFQNENLVAHRGDQLMAVAPDLICAISADGTPLTNADVEVGMDLTYLGFRAHPAFRTDKTIAGFRRVIEALGIGAEFVPIEHLVDREQ